jgi:Spy/CpxP family protein refolding chaperone
MTAKHLGYTLLLSTALIAPAGAQTANPDNTPAAQKSAMQKHAGQWRSSKMIGLDVYNQQNEKLGDINEILIDKSGKVLGYVIGVGGFLGMAEHDILVTPDKLAFANEPVRTAATNTAPDQRAADQRARQTTGTAADNNARRDADEKWWPDHAMLNASKDQLKAMPQFKYSNYN